MTQTQSPTDWTRQPAACWTGVGSSDALDSFAAGAAAAAAASTSPDAHLYLVFAAPSHDAEGLVAGVASRAGSDAVIVGATTAATLGPVGRSAEHSVVMALGGDEFSAAAVMAPIVGDDTRTAGEQVATAMWDVEDFEHSVLLVLSDGPVDDQRMVVQGADATLGGDIPLVGGCVGDFPAADRRCLFFADRDGNRLTRSHVIGVALSSSAPLAVEAGVPDSLADGAALILSPASCPPFEPESGSVAVIGFATAASLVSVSRTTQVARDAAASLRIG